MKKLLFFSILFLILFAMLSWSFNALGIIDVGETFMNLANSIPFLEKYMVNQSKIDDLKNANEELAAEVNSQKTEISELNENIEKLKQELAANEEELTAAENRYNQLVEEREDWQQKLQRTAKIYSEMEQRSAAAVIQELNTDYAVQILNELKEDQAAAILESMPQQKAAEYLSQLGS
jgi:flagellar motility protein MotE (MotC chaperone)